MKALHYKDICLLPNYSTLYSRQEADTSVEFLGRTFKLPIIPANMKCVLDEERAAWLSNNNYFYIMHRFADVYRFVADYQRLNNISISVGVKNEDKELLQKIKDEELRVDFITIDIAHGHSKLMKDMISFIKSLELDAKIIAGNICTYQAYCDLVEWGANAVKVGIGGGAACSTKNKTGFTFPMYSCIRELRSFVLDDVPIIADGGVREHADIVKAIHAGATMVMAGGLFSKLIDSPAELVDGHKVYFGSASQFNKGEYKHVEGIKRTLELDPMTYAEKLNEIKQDIQSAISYAGGDQLEDIRNANYTQVTHWEA